MTNSVVYIDESGAHARSPVLTLAGYVIKGDRIALFEGRWTEMLRQYGLPAFHMVDCAHGNADFKALTRDDRIAAATEAIQIIRDETAIGFAVTVAKAEHAALFGTIEPADSSGPYTLCLTTCLAMVARWLRESDFEGDVAYVFEHGHRDQAVANREMSKIFRNPQVRQASRYASHVFGRKAEFMALQAADILAWLWSSWEKNRSTSRPMRKDLIALLRSHDLALELDGPGELQGIYRKFLERSTGGPAGSG